QRHASSVTPLVIHLCFARSWSRRPPNVHSFPTRRSSDLWQQGKSFEEMPHLAQSAGVMLDELSWWAKALKVAREASAREKEANRSEEHTSELQSRENLVCRLLLEKKKHNKEDPTAHITAT